MELCNFSMPFFLPALIKHLASKVQQIQVLDNRLPWSLWIILARKAFLRCLSLLPQPASQKAVLFHQGNTACLMTGLWKPKWDIFIFPASGKPPNSYWMTEIRERPSRQIDSERKWLCLHSLEATACGLACSFLSLWEEIVVSVLSEP